MKLIDIFYEDAFHGSPHDFEPDPSNKLGKFKSTHIGTGEKAQAYGHGLYFTSSRDIANWYRKSLSKPYSTYDGRKVTPMMLNDAIEDNNPAAYLLSVVGEDVTSITKTHINKALSQLDKVKTKIASDIDGHTQRLARSPSLLNKFIADDQRKLSKIESFRPTLAAIQPSKFKYHGGFLYHVTIPDDDEYLMWDWKLSIQPTNIKRIVYALPEVQQLVDRTNKSREQLNKDNPDRLTHPIVSKIATKVQTADDIVGKTLYEYLSTLYGPAEASEYLLSKGIAGIKYLAADSRAGQVGNFNYVVFDDSRIEIKKRTLK